MYILLMVPITFHSFGSFGVFSWTCICLCYSTINLGLCWEHASESCVALWCGPEVMMMSRADLTLKSRVPVSFFFREQ
jgi:hypothetical protein